MHDIGLFQPDRLINSSRVPGAPPFAVAATTEGWDRTDLNPPYTS
jgi:hypothetical protein